MKKLFLILSCPTIIASCTVDKIKIVEELNQNINSRNYKQLSENLVENFEYMRFREDSIHNKEYFIEIYSKPTLKNNNFKDEIIDLGETDTSVFTIERHYRPIDTILQVKNLTEFKKTYYFNGNRVSKITIDTILNEGKYEDEMTKLSDQAIMFIEDKYGKDIEELNEKDRQNYFYENFLNYFLEYSKLSVKEKNEYKIRSYLKGTFISNDNPFYKRLEFKGKSTVIIYDPYIGFGFPTSYVIDEDFIRIRTDKSDLLLEIKDEKTLVGEGWAKGTFIKK